jgi:hypothetical protein
MFHGQLTAQSSAALPAASWLKRLIEGFTAEVYSLVRTRSGSVRRSELLGGAFAQIEEVDKLWIVRIQVLDGAAWDVSKEPKEFLHGLVREVGRGEQLRCRATIARASSSARPTPRRLSASATYTIDTNPLSKNVYSSTP